MEMTIPLLWVWLHYAGVRHLPSLLETVSCTTIVDVERCRERVRFVGGRSRTLRGRHGDLTPGLPSARSAVSISP